MESIKRQLTTIFIVLILFFFVVFCEVVYDGMINSFLDFKEWGVIDYLKHLLFLFFLLCTVSLLLSFVVKEKIGAVLLAILLSFYETKDIFISMILEVRHNMNVFFVVHLIFPFFVVFVVHFLSLKYCPIKKISRN